MPRISTKPPAYCLHKATGQARVRINGRDHYLGPYGTRESKSRYAQLVVDWSARCGATTWQPATPAKLASSPTVAEAILAYRKFALQHYRRDGKATREAETVGDAVRFVRKLFAQTPLAEFGPVRFKAVRQSMIDAGHARTTINGRMGRVRRWARWCVENELAPADMLHRIEAVPPLLPGLEDVRESRRVEPVPLDQIEAVLPLVRPPVRAMIELQLACGCRPGEVVKLTTGQVDRSGDVWVYRPGHHKTWHRGRKREIYIGPRGQSILAPWLKADPDAPLFSPAEDRLRVFAEKRAARKSKVQPSQIDRSKRRPKRKPHERYTVTSYARAIARGCEEAKIARWGPNRLRHTYATQCRARYGLEATQIMLGHSRADVTQIYAERDADKAVEIARKLG